MESKENGQHEQVVAVEREPLAVDVDTGKSQDGQGKSQTDGRGAFADYIRIFSYATTWDTCLLVVGSLASIGAGVALPLMNVVFGKLASNFSSFGSSTTYSVQPVSPDALASAADSFKSSLDHNTLFFVYIFIGKFTLSYIAMFSFRVTGIRLSAALRLAYLKALFSQSIGALDKLPPGQSASIITATANTLQIGISEKLALGLQFTALVISAYAIAFTYSWQLTLAASSMLLFVLLVFGIIIPISMKMQKAIDLANEKSSSIASEVFNSIRMVVACGAEKRVIKTYTKWVEESKNRGLKLSPVLGAQFAPVFFAVYASLGLVFWYGSKLYHDGDIDDVGTVLVVMMSVMMSVFSLSGVIAPLTAITKAASAASGFFNMIDTPPVNMGGFKDPDVSANADISFNKVTFAYPSRPHVKVLDHFDVCFESSKLTAIVGPSGSGKSTVVGLLERWYDLAAKNDDLTGKLTPNGEEVSVEQVEEKVSIALGGSVTIGGTELQDLDLKWWRSQIGLVQQEPFIFNDTIFKNVAYGLVGSKYENEDDDSKRLRVEEACKEAFADEFINRLPLGYETKVGESGIKLSGGQRQRLAIARSIIKRPTILIFDEATSAIDVRGERIVQEAMDRVAKNHTTITIAHRLSTIKKADKIIVVAKGKVVEQGTHESLLTINDGVYYNLVNAQSLSMNADVEELIKVPSSTLVMEDLVGSENKANVKDEEVPYKQRSFFQSFGLLLIEQNNHVFWLAATAVSAVAASAGQPLQSYIFGQIIGVFSIPRLDDALLFWASHWALMFTVLAIGTGVAYFFVGWSSNSLAHHVASRYRLEYFESMTEKPIEFFDADENSSGTLTSRVANDPQQIQEMMGVHMMLVFIAIFTILGCVLIAFVYGWKLTLVTVFSALPLIILATFYRVRFEIEFEKLNAAVFAESAQFASEAFGAFRTVTALTLEDMICNRYDVLLYEQVEKAKRKARFKTLVFALSDTIALPCMALAFWYGGRLVASLEYDIVQFYIIYVAVIQGSESAGHWFSFGPNMALASAAANRILSLRDWNKAQQKKTDVPDGGGQGGSEIAFSDVYFKYPTRDIPIFAGINLTIKKGQFAGLVGASGCGKTTIISLLEQFYRVDNGRITLDGIDIKELDIAQYRKLISLVAQEPALFQGTIRENILLAVEEDSVAEKDLHRACRDAEIHEFIMSLPDGYETDIGSKGVALSGGQKQRIAIARALIREPRILLLDEATSSLDSESEKLVQAAFERAGKGRTMVVVAHRLATVQNADVIFVLGNSGDGAMVLEKGTHAELVSRRGLYYQMCQSQALDR